MFSVPKELKCNQFKHVEIPSPEKVFARNGFLVVPSSQYTGDNLAPMPETKIDSISHVAQVNEHYLKAESQNDSPDD